MNFVVGALLLGRLGADSVLYQHLLSNASLSEEYFPSSRRSEIESEIFWATQVCNFSSSLT